MNKQELKNINNMEALNTIKVDELIELIGTRQEKYTFNEVVKILTKVYTLGFTRGNKKEKETHLKEYYTLEQLSQELDMNIQTLRKIVKAGSLKVSKVANRYITTRENINEWLKSNVITDAKLKETKDKFKASYIESLKNRN